MFVHVHGVRVYGLGLTFMVFGLGVCDGDSTDPGFRLSVFLVSVLLVNSKAVVTMNEPTGGSDFTKKHACLDACCKHATLHTFSQDFVDKSAASQIADKESHSSTL